MLQYYSSVFSFHKRGNHYIYSHGSTAEYAVANLTLFQRVTAELNLAGNKDTIILFVEIASKCTGWCVTNARRTAAWRPIGGCCVEKKAIVFLRAKDQQLKSPFVVCKGLRPSIPDRDVAASSSSGLRHDGCNGHTSRTVPGVGRLWHSHLKGKEEKGGLGGIPSFGQKGPVQRTPSNSASTESTPALLPIGSTQRVFTVCT